MTLAPFVTEEKLTVGLELAADCLRDLPDAESPRNPLDHGVHDMLVFPDVWCFLTPRVCICPDHPCDPTVLRLQSDASFQSADGGPLSSNCSASNCSCLRRGLPDNPAPE